MLVSSRSIFEVYISIKSCAGCKRVQKGAKGQGEVQGEGVHKKGECNNNIEIKFIKNLNLNFYLKKRVPKSENWIFYNWIFNCSYYSRSPIDLYRTTKKDEHTSKEAAFVNHSRSQGMSSLKILGKNSLF